MDLCVNVVKSFHQLQVIAGTHQTFDLLQHLQNFDKLWSIQLHFLYLLIALLIIIFHLIIPQSLATCCYMICVNFLRNTVLTSSSNLLTLKSLISFLVIEALVSPPTRYATYLTKYYPNASFNL